jgi:hypothetical protein
MIVIDLGAFISKVAAGPTDPTYEARCLQFDAERAWKMREPLEKALSWPKGTAQHGIWMAAYNAAKGGA